MKFDAKKFIVILTIDSARILLQNLNAWKSNFMRVQLRNYYKFSIKLVKLYPYDN